MVAHELGRTRQRVPALAQHGDVGRCVISQPVQDIPYGVRVRPSHVGEASCLSDDPFGDSGQVTFGSGEECSRVERRVQREGQLCGVTLSAEARVVFGPIPLISQPVLVRDDSRAGPVDHDAEIGG